MTSPGGNRVARQRPVPQYSSMKDARVACSSAVAAQGYVVAESGGRAVQRERVDAFGKRRGEKDRHRTALRHAHERGTLRPSRVHHGPHIIHAVLEARNTDRPVAQPRTDLVKGDHTCEPRYPFQPRRRGRPTLGVELRLRFETNPGTNTTSIGPSPITAYATCNRPGADNGPWEPRRTSSHKRIRRFTRDRPRALAGQQDAPTATYTVTG